MEEFEVGGENNFNFRKKTQKTKQKNLGQLRAACQVWKVRWVRHSTATPNSFCYVTGI